MSSFNRVILLGNLTRDVEVKYTPGGLAIADIGLAVNDKRKDAQGNWVEETTFVDCTTFGKTAEVAAEYLRKGSPLLVEGRLKFEWEKDGQKRNKLKVNVEKMQMIGGKQQRDEYDQRTEEETTKADPGVKQLPPLDDLPF